MGFKSFVLIGSIAFCIIFGLQNRGAIVLTFFGFNSPALPLFVWILMALFAGIISSLMINLLSNNPIPKNKKNQSFNPPYSPPPQPSPQPIKAKPNISLNQNPPIEKEKPQYQWEEDDVFEDLPDTPIINTPLPINKLPENEVAYPKTKIESESKTQEHIKETTNKIEEEEEIKIEEPKPIDSPSTEIETENKTSMSEITKLSEEDYPPENLLKPRQASPYSYQSREKTEINPKKTKKNPSQAKESPPQPKRTYKGVYDAPYRVIAPAQTNNTAENYDNFDDEDDDWDF
ncbi:hypothetical protein [Cyanobacterium aponinum]|uniref:Lipopolysaccharide assembly protein A domain-containing protein n=1 Tax=Cyanobacterium aponinum 0216 TaxID=2676140 RepID=A0A844GS28_9CHRO|nr:hypothetical protein [Cyanobacterium aponinum]MTF39287.1 hypothetical protein [Cyanobacterium aponinum 0216]